jgi:hypothetical protein
MSLHLHGDSGENFSVVTLSHHAPPRADASPFLHEQDTAEQFLLHVKPVQAVHWPGGRIGSCDGIPVRHERERARQDVWTDSGAPPLIRDIHSLCVGASFFGVLLFGRSSLEPTDLDPERLVFLDETGAKTNMVRLYGRAVNAYSRLCPMATG